VRRVYIYGPFCFKHMSSRSTRRTKIATEHFARVSNYSFCKQIIHKRLRNDNDDCTWPLQLHLPDTGFSGVIFVTRYHTCRYEASTGPRPKYFLENPQLAGAESLCKDPPILLSTSLSTINILFRTAKTPLQALVQISSPL
jgi:hypothetical protein